MVANSESGPTTPRRADAVANRKRLLDAARKAFAELGTNAEVKDIAERAGVGLGTIYRHFANKEDLLHAVVVEAVAEIERNTQEAIGCDDRPLEALRHYLAALLKATDTYGWLFDAAIGGHLPEPVIDGLDDHSPHAQLIDLLANGIQRGALAPGLDLPVAATMLLGLTVSWKYGPLRELMSLDDAVDRTLQVFLAGAASREA
jgi:AcrR family transcriptional regulator